MWACLFYSLHASSLKHSAPEACLAATHSMHPPSSPQACAHLRRPCDHVGHKVAVAGGIQQRHVARRRLKPARRGGRQTNRCA